MPQYLAELYVPRSSGTEAEPRRRQVRLAVAQLTRERASIRVVHSVFVPDDETCFVLCDAASVDAVREAAERADLRFDRIAEAEAPTIEEMEPCT